MNTALTIAGSDSCGGAGIQADLKTFSAKGVYGMSVVTAITAQNTRGVTAVQLVDLDVVEKQLEAVLTDVDTHAIKIGMMGSPELIEVVEKKIAGRKRIVLDPVLISKTGFRLVDDTAKEAIIERLIPIADIITPNSYEAEALTGLSVRSMEDMRVACRALMDMGARRIYMKSPRESAEAVDLYYDGNEFIDIGGEKISTNNLHGTGCTLSSAIAANLARGMEYLEAVKDAKVYITRAIEEAPAIGRGVGPVHHFHKFF